MTSEVDPKNWGKTKGRESILRENKDVRTLFGKAWTANEMKKNGKELRPLFLADLKNTPGKHEFTVIPAKTELPNVAAR